jgi:survival-of-motor-neuron-related-splicing factor 30
LTSIGTVVDHVDGRNKRYQPLVVFFSVSYSTVDIVTMSAEASTAAQELAETEQQLADVEELLRAAPEDLSLQSLRSDLRQLLEITRQSLAPSQSSPPPFASSISAAITTDTSPIAKRPGDASGTNVDDDNGDNDGPSHPHGGTDDADTHEPAKKKKKKEKLLRDFAVPSHLIPLDTDSEAERNRKRRALKSLKSKHREQQKHQQANQKQKSWQSFQKKKGHTDTSSMFATTDAKVGVVAASTGGRQWTDFAERQRHAKK